MELSRTPGILDRVDVRLSKAMLIVLWLGLCGAALLGSGVSRDSRVLMAPIAPVVIYLILRFPVARLAFVVGGGTLTLQGEEGLDALKLLYFLGAVICVTIPTLRFLGQRSDDKHGHFTPLLRWMWLWLALLILSFGNGIAQSAMLLDLLRGAIPYFLFAFVPMFAYDVSSSTAKAESYKAVVLIFVIAGLLTSLSWFVSWTQMRGYAELALDRLFLWSFSLAMSLFCFATSAFFHSRKHRVAAAIVALTIIVLFALTGTRQTLYFAVAPLVIILWGSGSSIRKLVRFGVYLVPAVIVGVSISTYIAEAIGLDMAVILDRFSGLQQITQDPTIDASYRERVQVTELTRQTFYGSPILGVSPGHRYSWTTDYARTKSGLSMDSPLAFPAAFGIVGVVVLLLTLWFLWRYYLDARRYDLPLELDALKAFTVMTIVYFLSGSPFEDKGLSFGFAILISLAVLKMGIRQESESSVTHQANESGSDSSDSVPNVVSK